MRLAKATIFSFYIFLIISCNTYEDKKDTVLLDTSVMATNAKRYLQNDEYLKAKLVYDSLIGIDSTNGEYYFKRGYSKSLLLYDDESAITDYLKSIYYGYHNKQSAYLNIGAIHALNKKFDSAIYYYNACLKIDPENSKAKTQKAKAMSILNNLK